jgi:hypothetical protein
MTDDPNEQCVMMYTIHGDRIIRVERRAWAADVQLESDPAVSDLQIIPIAIVRQAEVSQEACVMLLRFDFEMKCECDGKPLPAGLELAVAKARTAVSEDTHPFGCSKVKGPRAFAAQGTVHCCPECGSKNVAAYTTEARVVLDDDMTCGGCGHGGKARAFEMPGTETDAG